MGGGREREREKRVADFSKEGEEKSGRENFRARPRLEERNCEVSKDPLSFKHRPRVLYRAKFPPSPFPRSAARGPAATFLPFPSSLPFSFVEER